MKMRTAAAIFVAAHGVGYSIWFMAAWIPSALGGSSRNPSVLPQVTATGMLGKALGVVALLVLAGFLASAWGIWQQAPWWPLALVGSALASLPVAVAMWNPVGIVSVPATVASLALILATLLPWGERFLGTH